MADWQKGCRAMEITGAELFVKALKAEWVKMLFGYPGGHRGKAGESLQDRAGGGRGRRHADEHAGAGDGCRL